MIADCSTCLGVCESKRERILFFNVLLIFLFCFVFLSTLSIKPITRARAYSWSKCRERCWCCYLLAFLERVNKSKDAIRSRRISTKTKSTQKILMTKNKLWNLRLRFKRWCDEKQKPAKAIHKHSHTPIYIFIYIYIFWEMPPLWLIGIFFSNSSCRPVKLLKFGCFCNFICGLEVEEANKNKLFRYGLYLQCICRIRGREREKER